jgi:hypothetical protein
MDGSKRRATWVPYVVMLTACAALTPLQVWENRTRQAAWDSWVAAQLNERKLNDETYSSLLRTFDQMRSSANSRDVSRAEVEAALNGGKAFESLPQSQRSYGAAEGEEEVLYRDPQTGGRACIVFRNDRWQWVHSYRDWNTATAPPLREVLAVIRRIACILGIFVCGWLVLVALAHKAPRAAHWGLATAIGGAWASLLGPRYLHNWSRFFEDDSPGWWLFLFLPLALIAVARVHRSADNAARDPTCPDCGYNLTGNQSGICPECGAVVRHRLARETRRKTTAFHPR